MPTESKPIPMKRLLLFILFLFLILAQYYPLKDMLGPVDDSWITARYSYNIAHGRGIVFNPGENVEGCTAFGLMMILAIFGKIFDPANLVRVSQMLGIAVWALVCLLTYIQISKGRSGPIRFGDALALVFVIFSWVAMAWAYSGMETVLLAATWLGAVTAHFWEEENDYWPVLSALLTAASGLIRPDGILIAVIIGLSTLLPLTKKRFVRASVYSMIVLTLFGAYWLWRWQHFGYPYPNTFYAKVGSSSVNLFSRGASYIGRGLFVSGMPMLALAMLWRIPMYWKKVGRRLLVFGGVAILASLYLLYSGGDFFPMIRFYVPPLAFWALFFAELWRLPIAGEPEPEPKRQWKPVMLLIWPLALAIVTGLNTFSVINEEVHHQKKLVLFTDQWAQLGKVLHKQLPEDAKIATIPIGALGYWSDRYILDMLGLIDLQVARAPVPTGLRVIGHEKHDNKYVLGRRPELILIWPQFMIPTKHALIYWNQNNMLSDAQSDMIRRLRDNPNYVTKAIPVPVGPKVFVVSSVRSDLVDEYPYNTWNDLPKEAEKILYADVWQLRRVIDELNKNDRALSDYDRESALQGDIFEGWEPSIGDTSK